MGEAEGHMTRSHKVMRQDLGWALGLESSVCHLPSALSLPGLALASEQEIKLHFDLGFRGARLCQKPHPVGVWFMFVATRRQDLAIVLGEDSRRGSQQESGMEYDSLPALWRAPGRP